MSLSAQLIDIPDLPGPQEKQLFSVKFSVKFPQGWRQGAWVKQSRVLIGDFGAGKSQNPTPIGRGVPPG